MSEADDPHTPEMLKRLRAALAINRGMEFLETIAKEAPEQTVEHHEAQREKYLNELPERIHRALFRDWQSQPGKESAEFKPDPGRQPGVMPDAAKRETLRKVINEYLLSNGNNGTPESAPKLFDSHGFAVGTGNRTKRREECAEKLAEFYAKMREIHPFAYGNKLTEDFFMMALGKLPAFQAVHGDIDFRRLTHEETKTLHDPGSSINDLKKIFVHAMDPALTPQLENRPNQYYKWEKNETRIAGIRFLSHDHGQYLVTVNGGLVPTEDIKEKLHTHLVSGNMIDDFKVSNAQVRGHLKGTESLRQFADQQKEKYIDGFRTTPEAAPLVCLDVNILTGLRPSSHNALVDLLEKTAGKGATVHKLNKRDAYDTENDALMEKLHKIAGDDERLNKAIDIAYSHINHITKQLDEEKIKLFEGKTPVEHPALFMSMGGAASGKSNVESMMKAQYNNNVVVASLDEFRKSSQLYDVLQAANHHADDYSLIEPFGNTLRDWVAAHARGERAGPEGKPVAGHEKYNLLFDGTGILYQPRYANLIDKFKQAGFATQVVAVDRPYEEAVGYVESRAHKEGRALPWSVVAGKHSRMPRSMLQALEDVNLDKFSVFHNMSKKHLELLAETFAVENGNLDAVRMAQGSGNLRTYMAKHLMEREDATLKRMAAGGGNSQSQVDALLKRPEENVACLYYTVKGQQRMLAVYDVQGLTKVLGKGLMNSHASSPDDVYPRKDHQTAPSALAFLADTASWVAKIFNPAAEGRGVS